MYVAWQSRVAGLDRGLVATPADQDAVNQAARKLESAGNAVEFPDDLDLLQGRWRLVYSSAFASGSVGGQRPGPPIGRLVPLTLGQVLPRGQVLLSVCLSRFCLNSFETFVCLFVRARSIACRRLFQYLSPLFVVRKVVLHTC